MKPPKIIIIGAGPAGAAASLFLSKAGVHHTILDKANFPRDKVCGDAISGKVLGILDKLDGGFAAEMAALTDAFFPSWGVSFIAPNGKCLDLPYIPQVPRGFAPGFISRRLDFDAWLASKTGGEYAEKIFGKAVDDVRQVADGVEVVTGGEVMKADLVIGAEGDRSLVARKLLGAVKEEQHYGASVRAYYRGVEGLHPQGFIELHFIKRLLPGYFWIFPLPGGKVNVGLAVLSSQVSRRKMKLRGLLDEIIANEPAIAKRFLNAVKEGDTAGWGLPLGSKKRPLSGNRFMLVGDAASLIDPFTGEGIGNGMLSGMVAAKVAAEAVKAGRFDTEFLWRYDEEIYRRLWGELKLSHTLQKLVRFPWLFNLVVSKTRSSKTLRETFMAMFENLDIRSRLSSPGFYVRLLFNR